MLSETPVTSSSSQDSTVENTLGDTPITSASSQSPPMQTWLRWKWLRFLLPGVVVLLGSVALGPKLMDLLPTNKSTAKPLTQSVERKTMPVSITANATVKAQRSINLSPKTAGIIKTLLVKEGDQVRQGQVIALMDDSNLRGQLLQYQGQLAQQEANLQRLQAGNRPEDIAKAEAQLAEAKANLQQLQAGNRPEEIAQGEAQLAEAKANLRQLQAGNRPEDIAKAEAQLAEAKANLRQLQAGNRPQEIAQASARLQQAQATLKQKEGDWQRYQQLYTTGAISGQNLEQKRAERDVAQNQVLEAQQVLALQKAGTRPEQIAQAQAKVEQQIQAVALLKAGNRSEQIAQAQAKVEMQIQAVALLKAGNRSEQIAQAQAKVEQQAQTLAALKAGTRSEDIAQARAQVQSAQGALKTIQEQLKETKIMAPFDGIVLEKFADVGAFVSPSMGGGGGASASSSSILTLTGLRQQVVVNLSESQITKVKLGQTVTITADAFPGETFTGKVEQIAPQAKVSQNVTSVEVRVSINSAATGKLKAGMNVEAQFAVGQLENVMFVPNASVVKQAEGAGVYVWGGDNKSVFRPIQIGTTVGKQTEVKSGLEGKEEVLLSPPAEQKPAGGLKFPPAR
jgi:HlyD family secretion protein